MNREVDKYIARNEQWKEEIEAMRSLALDCNLQEDLKWGSPCYTLNNANIVLIHTFKEYCAYLFFKGALMEDIHQLLIQQTKNVQSARQIRFTSLSEIHRNSDLIKSYIYRAIEIEKSGAEVSFKKTKDLDMPEELHHKF
jgi:uncharacterized protein YdeI (YjbR/CyaY-like superfamily)